MTRLTDHRRAVLLGAAVLILAATPATAGAQSKVAAPRSRSDLARAEALLKAGRVEAAEALYYREVRRRGGGGGEGGGGGGGGGGWGGGGEGWGGVR
jgi:hypothetical protein